MTKNLEEPHVNETSEAGVNSGSVYVGELSNPSGV